MIAGALRVFASWLMNRAVNRELWNSLCQREHVAMAGAHAPPWGIIVHAQQGGCRKEIRGKAGVSKPGAAQESRIT